MLPMDFSIVNLGCKVNRVESDDVAALLIAKGSKPVALADAQLIVINTCTVTGEAEKKTRKAVRHALRSNDSATVVVTGCAVAIDPTAYEEMSPRVRIVPKGDLMKAVSAAGSPDSLRLGGSFPTRAITPARTALSMLPAEKPGHVLRQRLSKRLWHMVLRA